jgi:hypothetical protein
MDQNLGLNGTQEVPTGTKVRVHETVEDLELYWANREGEVANYVSFDDAYIVKIEIQDGDDPYYYDYLGDTDESKRFTLVAMNREEFEVLS